MATSDERTGTEQGRRQFLRAAGTASIVGTSVLAGCTGPGEDDGDGNGGSTGTATPTAEAKTGGTLAVATQSDPGKLDPHLVQEAASLRVLNNVYQKLTVIDEELKPVSQLATDLSVSDDGLTWEVQLQEGVTFHPPESRELTASDVVYSIKRLKADETGSPWQSNFTPISNVSADGDYTVVFEFDDPYAPFLTKLTSGGFVVPEGAAESDDYDLGNQPVGSGPFVFEETVAQTRTTLTKFDEYWETDDDGNSLPYLDEVEYRPMPEGQARVNAIQTGEVDLVVAVPRSQAGGLEGASGVVFSNKPGTFYDYIGHNTTNPPLDDVKLRQAISWAVNRQSLVKGARFGYATPTQDPIPPESVWKDLITVDEPYSQDTSKAEGLISESKYNGEELEIQVGQGFQGQVDEAEIVAEQLRDAGLTVSVRPLEFSTMISNLNDGNFQLALLGWVGFTDPDDLFYVEFHTDEVFNQTNYSNEEVDGLLEEGRTATGSREERAQFYDDAVDIIAREAPYTFLVFNEEVAAWRESVKNFTHNPTGTPRFEAVWKDE